MIHAFDVEIAKSLGVLEALLLNYFDFWVTKNEANGTNFHNGRYWTYNSVRAFTEQFPYASKDRIVRAIKHLRDEGLVETGDFNTDARVRTLWYTLTDKAKRVVGKCEMHFAQAQNADCSDANSSITVNNKTVNNTVNNQNIEDAPKDKKFKPPKVEEVRAYCNERHNNIDPERFVDYYTSVGWLVSKGKKMTDWRSAVRNWERMDKERKGDKSRPNGEREYDADFFTRLEQRDAERR